jgi:hypothetical protein
VQAHLQPSEQITSGDQQQAGRSQPKAAHYNEGVSRETGDQTDQESRSTGVQAATSVSAMHITIDSASLPHTDAAAALACYRDTLGKTFAKLESSATEDVQEPIEQPYGVRDCGFRDPRQPDPHQQAALSRRRSQLSTRLGQCRPQPYRCHIRGVKAANSATTHLT